MKTLKVQNRTKSAESICRRIPARMRYDYFAKQARKEGLEQIAAIFEETSMNERSHAKHFKFLKVNG